MSSNFSETLFGYAHLWDFLLIWTALTRMENIFPCIWLKQTKFSLLAVRCWTNLLCYCDSVPWVFFSRAPVFSSVQHQCASYFLCGHLITVCSQKYVTRFCNSLTWRNVRWHCICLLSAHQTAVTHRRGIAPVMPFIMQQITGLCIFPLPSSPLTLICSRFYWAENSFSLTLSYIKHLSGC